MFTIPKALPRQITHPIVGVLARLGVSPAMLTVAQLVGGLIAGVIIARGELVWGGAAMLLAAVLDAFDGTLARTTGRVTRFGGVLDSTFDRLFEGAVFAGLLYFYLDSFMKTESMLVFIAMLGSLCVSYVRARAEVEGVSLFDGIFTRGVRILLLAFGLLTAELIADGLVIILWVMAIMTMFTTFHRLFAVWLKLKDEDRAA